VLLRPHNRNNPLNRALARRRIAMVFQHQRNPVRHRVNTVLPRQHSNHRNPVRHRVNTVLPRQHSNHRNPMQPKSIAFAV
jgi:hypothetical protein